MKPLALMLALCMLSAYSFAQEIKFESGRQKHDNKPAMFGTVSSRFAPSQTFLTDVMNFRLNQEVDIFVTNGLRFKGKVTAVTSDAPGLTTVTLQSSDKPGLLLSLSRVILPDQSISYRGIMMSKKHSDLLMMEKDAVTGNYTWTKKQVSNMLAD